MNICDFRQVIQKILYLQKYYILQILSAINIHTTNTIHNNIYNDSNTYYHDIFKIYKEDLPWEKLCGCHILVTGASGLIGSSLIEVLMERPERDYEIYARIKYIQTCENFWILCSYGSV